jgi:hypothetical protein
VYFDILLIDDADGDLAGPYEAADEVTAFEAREIAPIAEDEVDNEEDVASLGDEAPLPTGGAELATFRSNFAAPLGLTALSKLLVIPIGDAAAEKFPLPTIVDPWNSAEED